MTKKRKISKKEAEEIRLAIAEIAIDHSLKDICYIGVLQLFGSHLFLKLIHSRCKCLERINFRLLQLLIKLYDFYYES